MIKRGVMTLALLFGLLPLAASAAATYFTEKAQFIRFEQYTSGTLAMWRMPSPGTSTFPGGNCTALIIPGSTTMSNRFMALYLYAKTENINYFVYYDTSNCQVISFGLDG